MKDLHNFVHIEAAIVLIKRSVNVEIIPGRRSIGFCFLLEMNESMPGPRRAENEFHGSRVSSQNLATLSSAWHHVRGVDFSWEFSFTFVSQSTIVAA